MLLCVLDFYGFTNEKVVVKFSKAGLTNQNNLATILAVLKQNDMIDDFTAIEMFFNDKNSKQHPVKEAGELVAKGDNIMKGYLGDEEGTAAALKDGWLHTGDLGRQDQDGFVSGQNHNRSQNNAFKSL